MSKPDTCRGEVKSNAQRYVDFRMAEAALERFLAEQRYKCERLLKEIDSSVVSGVDKSNPTPAFCSPSFDGLLCWPRTAAARLARLPCPPRSVLGYNDDGDDNEDDSDANTTITWRPQASKLCLPAGQWYRNLDGVAWSNYTPCTPAGERYVTAVVDLGRSNLQGYGKPSDSTLLDKWLPIIRTVSHIGYASSFTTLVIAMVIFSLLRKLRNPRNRLHMHLFASFILRAFMALLKDLIFVDGIGMAWDIVLVDGKSAFIKEHNTWICKAITSIWQYCIVANYAWILMEGLYLHNLIFLALCTDTTTITSYVLLGWGLPLVVVVPWIVIRATIEDTLCWTTHKNQALFLVIRIPIMISILFNFLLFINIVRVLLVKLKTSVYLQRKKMQYRRWAKSTLVLVPLFGAHYTLFLGLSYYEDDQVELVWLFCDQLFASFQGSFVALLYCLLNGEVRAEMRRVWKAQRSKRDVESLVYGHREAARNFPRSTRSCDRLPREHHDLEMGGTTVSRNMSGP